MHACVCVRRAARAQTARRDSRPSWRTALYPTNCTKIYNLSIISRSSCECYYQTNQTTYVVTCTLKSLLDIYITHCACRRNNFHYICQYTNTITSDAVLISFSTDLSHFLLILLKKPVFLKITNVNNMAN